MRTGAKVFLAILGALAAVMLFLGALNATHYAICGSDGCYDDAVNVGRGIRHYFEDVFSDDQPNLGKE